MKVYGINPKFSANEKNKNYSFTGYYDILRETAKTPVKDLKHAQGIFNGLISGIETDNTIVKNQFFDAVKNLCNNTALKDIFNKLIKSEKENSAISYIMKSLRDFRIVSVANDNSSVLDIISLSGKSNDIRIGFGAGKRKGYIEFYTDKKGDVFVDRSYGKSFYSRGFYTETGTKKVDISIYEGGSPEKTYYNKDGSKPFFKNLFLGGTPTEGIY